MIVVLKFNGKVVVITGGAYGIGKSMMEQFMRAGATVAVIDIAPGPIYCDFYYRGDLADETVLEDFANQVIDKFGKIDYLINNAGVTQPVKIMEIDEASWDRILDINTKGVLFLSQAFIPHMRERKKGSIACMSSVSAQRGGGIFGGPHYSAAKGGVLSLARAMAREFGPSGVRVNNVAPGLIQTDITAGKLTDEMKTEILKGIPLNRLGDATDVAKVCLFLASDLSSYVTGATLDVNGGMLIH